MGKGKPRSVEKGAVGPSNGLVSRGVSLNIPAGPVFYPSEDEFKDPLEYIYKIRPEAEPYGICKIVPPRSWKPPFALDLDSFVFPTKTQAIHQLQARCASCDPKTFGLEYGRFLEEHCGKKVKKRVVFEGEELDLCKLFNAVKRFGGYDKVVKGKKWGEVFRFVQSGRKISDCAKHVLSQLYREHLYDYEKYYNWLNKVRSKGSKRGLRIEGKKEPESGASSSKKRRKNNEGKKIEIGKLEEEEEEEVHDQICEQCRSGLHGEVMLLCDRCNKGWHTYCLSPPLKQVPPGNWYCLDCLNSEKDSFGFVPGKQFSLEAFRRLADRAKKKWFGSTSPSRFQLEKKFWDIVDGLAGEVEVMYGSDLDTSVYGSGFPRTTDQRPSSVGIEEWNEYCASKWNLNNLPKLQGSMLQAVHHNIAGVMVPWLYMGMLFSSFCWHFEDHCFYSMNYHHWGEPKCWYSVPGSEANAFEKVMRNSLPDLFDAQPDLLFQLVTMLNPSVLQENGVPVYSVVQEPGNFVITFPRSYHGGFNFGLNCAEAVNFAPADWLPHGGFGAELYRLYRKTAVLSHEELLCVVAKSELDSKVSPYLRKELLRIYNKEKTWRERLWKNGIVNSSPMSPRQEPEYVGVQEDPTCIICQQFLYLSAVSCPCQPSAFVCLEHWEHLCECKPNKHRLVYRHSLAELSSLVLTADQHTLEDAARNSRRQLLSLSESAVLSKKVKGHHITHLQLAEKWMLSSFKLIESQYRRDAYDNALTEAEQFLWAGSEMDPVRGLAKNLTEAQIWAEAVRDCLHKVELWLCHDNRDIEKITMEHVNKLLSVHPIPCNEPAHLKLQVYQQEAEKLIQEIESALLTRSETSVAAWESLYSKALDAPIHVNESQNLLQMLTSVKAWRDNVRKCILEKSPASVEADVLYKLEAENLELQVRLPEAEMLSDLVRQVESCHSRCKEVLKGPISLKKLELLVKEFDSFHVNLPELRILRDYHSDALTWITRVNRILMDVHERGDQENVLDELMCLQKDGILLKVQVDELPLLEIEIKKACCRVKGLKALQGRMSMDFILQLLTEATTLNIEREKLFVDISGIYTVAVLWEEKAKHILTSDAEMSEYQDVIRSSQGISVILPSLKDIEDAVFMANSWLSRSKPYLSQGSSSSCASTSFLDINTLKDLVSESELLRIPLNERLMLQSVLDKCITWEQEACSVLHTAQSMLKIDDICEDLTTKIEFQINSMESIIVDGVSLGIQFDLIPKLQDACSILKWCLKALSSCGVILPLKGVEMLLEVASHLPVAHTFSPLYNLLIEGINWLKEALEIMMPNKFRQIKLSDAEKVLQSQKPVVSFPVVVSHLQNTIRKHNSWLEQHHQFFNLNLEERSWPILLQLKELGIRDAFNCTELNLVLSEVEKVEQWKRRCEDVVKPSVEKDTLLLDALSEMKNTLDISVGVYNILTCGEARAFCILCSSNIEDQKLSCLECKYSFHIHCVGLRQEVPNDASLYVCPYCDFLKSGKISLSGCSFLRVDQKRPELDTLVGVSSITSDLCLWIEEKILLDQIVEKALQCSTCLAEIVDFVLNYCDKDIIMVTRKLSAALQAIEVAGVRYWQDDSKFGLALARNSWKIRAKKLLEGSPKATFQQIRRHLKEGLAIGIRPDDYFRQRLAEIEETCLQWSEKAKEVSVDGGALELDGVFELITEGENLPACCLKELKLLRERSMLYCICRRPYDQRAMIACDRCDEWYHFDCIKLSSAPKVYICPACNMQPEEDLCASSPATEERCGKFEEPQTPCRRTELRKKAESPKADGKEKIVVALAVSKALRHSSGIGQLLWRNRKPFRRAARKRVELDSLSPFFHVQNN